MKVDKSKKTYWKGLEQLSNDSDFVKYAEKEFAEDLPIKDAYGDNSQGHVADNNRRDFLKLMGFSVAAVSLAACEAPVRKAIPYLNKPEDVDPGIPNYYASTYVGGGESWPVVVKTREGRPIFIQGNELSSITKGGTSPRVNASVMALYDDEKAKKPTKEGQVIDWETADKEIADAFGRVAVANGSITIVSNTITSPTTKKAIETFLEKYPTAKLVQYDPESLAGLREANKRYFGKAMVPSYHFHKADVIVSLGADFLGNWISGIEFTAQYTSNRKVSEEKPRMSQHFQFEAMMSITGASADYRSPVKPSQEGLVAAKLYNLISGSNAINAANIEVPFLAKAADALKAAKGKSLVVSGSNDPNVQLIVNAINDLLGNYGQTIDTSIPSFQRQGDDAAMADFVADLAAGKEKGVIFLNCNPVYDHPDGSKILENIGRATISVATSERLDETASVCSYNCPDTHFLEAWGDAELKKGHFALGQPTIRKIFDTRQASESLLKWSGNADDYHTFLKNHWRESVYPLAGGVIPFEQFWNKCLHDGVFEASSTEGYNSIHEGQTEEVSEVAAFDISSVGSAINAKYKATNEELELVVYSTTLLGNGDQANNPILQETPDPITKVCWGNFIAVPLSWARENGLNKVENVVDVLKLTLNDQSFELAVIVQPGLAKGTLAIALGYGRDGAKAGKVAAEASGTNAFQLLAKDGKFLQYATFSGVKLEKTSKREPLAQTQTYQTIMGRETIIQETTLAAYQNDPKSGAFEPKISGKSGKFRPTDISVWDIKKDGFGEQPKATGGATLLWNERLGYQSDVHQYTNHHWGLAIDLNSCNGCSACVVACTVENNVPVVGKEEVIRRREMHWLRIDRYYSSVENDEELADSEKGMSDHLKMELAAENPEVVFQPMMCQHCNNAPCETVCPVAATTHSSEGLNQMTYNRCIGTKYCANNCPYKVRRFNWFRYHNNDEFDYHMNNDYGKMVLNPDVTVRSRGVMEKCSLCVQRIQAGKLKAKLNKREVIDGDATTACASACPSQAIVFGDLNSPNSQIRKMMEKELDGRAYAVLDEINTRPNVWYLRKVRNKTQENA